MNAPELQQTIALKRDCDAILIPHGTPIQIAAGTEVMVTQALGGSVTVNIHGNLARIAGKDLDALGMEPQNAAPQVQDQSQQDGGVNEELLWEQLRTCYDPEIPINIVDLGLVYKCEVTPLTDGGGNRIDVRMTLTAPGCGMGPVLQQDVQNKLLALEAVDDVAVELVWDPPWNQGMLTEAAKLQLGLV